MNVFGNNNVSYTYGDFEGTVIGNNNVSSGSWPMIFGNSNTTNGWDNPIIFGKENAITGHNGFAFGMYNTVK